MTLDSKLTTAPPFPAALCGYDPERAQRIAERPILFYRPGGKAGRRVYTTWSELFQAFQATTGPVTISIDATHGCPAVPIGYWDFEGRAILMGSHGIPVFWIPKEAHVQNVLMFSRLEIKNGRKKPEGEGIRQTSADSTEPEEQPEEEPEEPEEKTSEALPTEAGVWDAALDRAASHHQGLLKALGR
jgi:hypothetical protein